MKDLNIIGHIYEGFINKLKEYKTYQTAPTTGIYIKKLDLVGEDLLKEAIKQLTLEELETILVHQENYTVQYEEISGSILVIFKYTKPVE